MGKQVRLLLSVAFVVATLVLVAMDWALDGGSSSDRRDGTARDAATGADAPTGADRTRRTSSPARVTGEVRASADRKPVAGRTVTLSGVRPRTLEATTDERGAFTFPEVPHGGPYEVAVAAEGL